MKMDREFVICSGVHHTRECRVRMIDADDMTESGMTMGDYFPPGYEVSEIGRVRASGDIHMMTNCYEEVR